MAPGAGTAGLLCQAPGERTHPPPRCHTQGLSPSQPPSPFVQGTSHEMQRLGAGPGSLRTQDSLEQELWPGTHGAGQQGLIPFTSKQKPLIDGCHERRKSFRIPLNFPTPRMFPSRLWGWRISPLIFPGAAQIFPAGPSSAGQHPGHNQEGKLTQQPRNVPLYPLQGKRGLCSVAFGTKAVTTCTLTWAQLPKGS